MAKQKKDNEQHQEAGPVEGLDPHEQTSEVRQADPQKLEELVNPVDVEPLAGWPNESPANQDRLSEGKASEASPASSTLSPEKENPMRDAAPAELHDYYTASTVSSVLQGVHIVIPVEMEPSAAAERILRFVDEIMIKGRQKGYFPPDPRAKAE